MLNKITKTVVAISIYFIVLFSSLFSLIYNIDYYDRKYAQYNVYDRFSRETALNATSNIFGFFNSENSLDMNFFNEDEASHLQDVKNLIVKSRALYYSSIAVFWVILIAYYMLNKKELIKFFADGIFYGGVFTISLIFILGFLYLTTGFNFLFIKFHEIFFTGNYAFNPAVSNMKALFPDAFFQDMALKIILTTIIKAILLTGAGYLMKRKKLFLHSFKSS